MFTARQFPVQNRLLDIFRTGGEQQNNQQQQPIQQQSNQQQQPLQQSNQSNANPNDPNQQQNKQQQQQNNENKSPLAEFSNLWDDGPAPKDGESAQPDWNDHNSVVPDFKVDPKKLVESARKIDFSKAMNPEKVAAALKGDVGAFSEVINTVAQATFANMAMTTSRMVNAMQKQMAEKLYTGALPHHFRKHQVNAQIDADNPIFADPAVAPMLEMAKNQMQVKYPKASPKEISDMAKKMISGFVTAAGGKLDDGTAANNNRTSGNKNAAGKGGLNKQGTDQDNWEDFFGVGGPAQ